MRKSGTRKKIIYFGQMGSGMHIEKQGGLGVSNLQHMNVALIIKWWWKIIATLERNISILLREKYGNKYGMWSDREIKRLKCSQFLEGITSSKKCKCILGWNKVYLGRG